jgi:hypothetical protein
LVSSKLLTEVTALNPTINSTQTSTIIPIMNYADYVRALGGRENEPASLAVLLGPFNIAGVPFKEDEFLMVGHVLDAMAEGRTWSSPIDAVTVLELALDLGFNA